MKTINEAMKKLQEAKRISLKEANEIATFELDWANEDIANMENDQEKELTLIKNVENTLKTNSINAKVEVISLDGNGFGGWPIVKVTGPKEDLAKNIGLYYLDNNEDEIDYNDIYDTYLENKELKEAEPTKLDDIVKVDPNKKEITYPKQDKNDPRKPSDITKDELLNSDKNEKELPSTENGTAKKEIQDMLDRSWNRKYNIGIENEDYWKDREAGKCYKCGKIIPDNEKYIIDGQQYCLDCKGDAEQELLDQPEPKRNIDNFNDYEESKLFKEAEEKSEEVKEYHKLSRDHIEELIKTGKLDDYFDTLQRDEIRTGLEKGIDISKYADPKYNWVEMRRIRHKLKSNNQGDTTKNIENSKTIKESTEYQSDKELEMRKFNESSNGITLDDIANKASELGYEILGDERDDEGLTILVYKPESAETDNFDDFDNEELYSYLSTIPNVRYQIDNDDQSCLVIWLKESKVVKESNDLEEKDATDMLREIEEWYKNYSSSNAFYEDLSNIIDYNKLINWYKSL